MIGTVHGTFEGKEGSRFEMDGSLLSEGVRRQARYHFASVAEDVTRMFLSLFMLDNGCVDPLVAMLKRDNDGMAQPVQEKEPGW